MYNAGDKGCRLRVFVALFEIRTINPELKLLWKRWLDSVVFAFGHEGRIVLLVFFAALVFVAVDVGVMLKKLLLVAAEPTLADAWQKILAYKLINYIEADDDEEEREHLRRGKSL